MVCVVFFLISSVNAPGCRVYKYYAKYYASVVQIPLSFRVFCWRLLSRCVTRCRHLGGVVVARSVEFKDHMLTIAEVASKLNVSIRTVQRFIKNGKLRAHQVGGQKRIAPVAVEQMLRGVELPSEYDNTWQKLDLF